MSSKLYQNTKEAVLKEMDSSTAGLSAIEAKKRIEQYGANELAKTKSKSTFILFLEQFKDFLVIILMTAAIISAILGDGESAFVIFLVLTINAILGTVQNVKSAQSLNSLKQLSAPLAKVLRDGIPSIIPSREVVIGDIVQLEAGDYICADGRIVENASLKINESALTGESISIEKVDAPIAKEVTIGDRLNMVFSGSFVTYGRGSFLVTDTGMDTEVGKIASLLKETKEKKTPLQVSLDQFGRKLSIGIILICFVLFLVSTLRGETILDAFLFAVALAVAAIPEALSSIVTIVLSFGTQKMAKEHAIIRKLHAVEGLGSVSIVCSDKTGTLTQNKMTVKYYYIDEGIINADTPQFEKEADQRLIRASILCNDAVIQDDTAIGDPTETALVDFGKRYGYSADQIRAEHKRLGEVPFDSERKLMSTVHADADGHNIMFTKGAVDVLLDRISSLTNREVIEDMNLEFSKNGLRVLCFATKIVSKVNITMEDEYDLEFMGLIAMMDPPREESAEAVADCLRAGIKPIMITGDHKITASSIARQIGILKEDKEAVEGAEIENLTDKELQSFVEHFSVYARVSPEHKIRIVRAWQEKGNVVAMTGDGVNDAPALKQADIGIAMGITGSEVAKDAASMILTDDNFATIIKAVENGRNIYNNVKRAIQFLLSGNTAALLSVLYASLVGLSVPFAPVHLLFINLLTDSLPAIALGLEPHKHAVMSEKPRPSNRSILTMNFMLTLIRDGFVISLFTMTAFYIGLFNGGREVASTMAFATLCLSRLMHGFNCKSKKAVIFTRQLFHNMFLWGAFAIGALLLTLVLLIPALHPVFHVASLDTSLLLTVYGLSLGSFIVIQILKTVVGMIDREN